MFATNISLTSNQNCISKNLIDLQSESSFIDCGVKPLEALLTVKTSENMNFNFENDCGEFQNLKYELREDEIHPLETDEIQQNHFSRMLPQLKKPYLGEIIHGENSEHVLHAGDRLQLAETNLFVLENRVNNITESIINKPIQVEYINPGEKKSISEEVSCRICLSSSEESDEVLIQPCECKGSNNYVHLSCFKTWLEKKKPIYNKPGVAKFEIFTQRSISCDICKQIVPWKISIGGQEVELIPINRPENANYIVLEKIDPSGIRSAALMRDFPEISIGRDLKANIILHDPAGSRNHGKILLKQNGYVIKDSGSKFGIISEIKKNVKLTEDMKLKYKSYLLKVKKSKKIIHDDEEADSDKTEGSDDENVSSSQKVSKKSKKIKKNGN